MEAFGLPDGALVNYIFPNNAHVTWSIMIVIYPYITGLVAGAFVLSSMYHVFGVKEFKPIANFALVAAFSFGLFAAMPLLVHLGQPQRAYQIYTTPHTTSAMSIFGYVYSSYLVLLMIEIWVIYRKVFIEKANEAAGNMAIFWKILCLGITTYNPESAAFDKKLAKFLAGIGIPWACLLHGYVGFVFGSVKAVAWWATALQPFIFLSSAIVSGIAMMFLMYSFIMWRRGQGYDYVLIKKFIITLWIAFILDYALEILEITFVSYEQGAHWAVIKPLLMGPLYNSYVLGQMGFLSLGPILVLGIVSLLDIRDKALLYLGNLGSLMLIFQVLVMRFNVVVGGQLISKSERGFVHYEFEFFAKEGLLTAGTIMVAPFVTYYVISRFIPIFEGKSMDTEPKRAQM
ncbi:MAG: polysulfide reductase NrfD [Rhodospirillaceae bacterium]|jgi:Ni/Fe-hydrogenase subunit HybB-like protein|nr:polysulfide reductase NrfD [Rhodospirillaceae bacterium]MBT5243531.1 polysulfide reductase NrfD [Rhodospirillaceae bacterium]MBT5562119.1 polysulfide reductase NrfD [Rhodospirillaceae bacterium]MBT6242292.1 polysulfide reductase NrfD [Rhodospirillaceae bacterium]MBT7137696.1 polysulfide reductase NrfD [Rhodospirillaceae bacterium]